MENEAVVRNPLVAFAILFRSRLEVLYVWPWSTAVGALIAALSP